MRLIKITDKDKVMNTKSLVVVCFALIVAVIACNDAAQKNQTVDEYTVKPAKEIIVYGVNSKKVLRQSFAQIEKETGTKIQTDHEVSVIFIRQYRDFALKSEAKHDKDSIDYLYGPVNDQSLFSRPGSISPNAIVLYGYFKLNEKMSVKKSIISQLEKILPPDQTTKVIVNKIERDFLMGSYHEGPTLQVNFDTPDFAVSYFLITFMADQLHYRYVFSKTKEIYPYL